MVVLALEVVSIVLDILAVFAICVILAIVAAVPVLDVWQVWMLLPFWRAKGQRVNITGSILKGACILSCIVSGTVLVY